MQLKYYWSFLPSKNWESFYFVTILHQSQMETARHYVTILCLYCIGELHIHIKFSTGVAFPVSVPISSLFFTTDLSSHLSHFLQCCHMNCSGHGNLHSLSTGILLPPHPDTEVHFWAFSTSFPQPLPFSFSTTAPDPVPSCLSSAEIPAQKQLWKGTCAPCMTHPFPGMSPQLHIPYDEPWYPQIHAVETQGCDNLGKKCFLRSLSRKGKRLLRRCCPAISTLQSSWMLGCTVNEHRHGAWNSQAAQGRGERVQRICTAWAL